MASNENGPRNTTISQKAFYFGRTKPEKQPMSSDEEKLRN